MSTRCASCNYPLSVSDSVKCYECSSYFHIDCAQLVGFPYYELSDDPNRNTFHCRTCELLPLPTEHCDSDSDTEGDMPSRHLDYHLEAQADFAQDMNDVKGSVQDLSTLCKDILREINEIKSINLTLRCCIENLRHENEERDFVITDLKRRIEALEGGPNIVREKISDSANKCESNILALGKESHNNHLVSGTKLVEAEVDSCLTDTSTNSELQTEIIISPEDQEVNEAFKSSGENKNNPVSKQTPIDDNTSVCTASIHSPSEGKEIRQDWTWKGKIAVELEKEGDEIIEELIEDNDENGDDEGETDESELEDEVEGWETLHEEIEAELKQHLAADKIYGTDESIVENEKNSSNYTIETDIMLDKAMKNADFTLDKVKTSGPINTEKYEPDDVFDEETDNETESVQTLKDFKEELEETPDEIELAKTELKLTSNEVCASKNVLAKNSELEDVITQKNFTITETQSPNHEESLEEDFKSNDEEVLADLLTSNNLDRSEEYAAEEVKDNAEEQRLNNDSFTELEDEEEEDEVEEAETETNAERENLHDGNTDPSVQDIRPDDFVEVEVGEIPEEGENEDLTSADEMHDECFGKTEPEETENNHTHTFEDKVRPEEETCTEEPLMKGDPCLGGDELQEREHRLEEEPRGELEVVTEEEGRLGGQSQIDGEVQPSENSETLPPQHTEEDLWHYLREAVTGEHPSTVEEFLQNLIGTLQHVPQEYLTPVVEANIKRANSPSSQDGDPLRTLGDGPTEEKEVTSLEVTPNLEEGSVPAHEGSPASKQVVLDGTSQCPEEETNTAADNEGYSPVEAAA